MGCQDCVVGLDAGRRDFGGWIDVESQLRYFAIIDWQPFHEERAQPRSSASSKGVINKEPLKRITIVCQLSDPIQSQLDEVFSNRVIASREVIRSVLLAWNHLRRVEQFTICSGSHLVDHSWLQIEVNWSGHIPSCLSLWEESAKSLVVGRDGHYSVCWYSMLKTEEFPAGISKLYSSLPDV